MSTTDPPNTAPIRLDIPGFDQVVKGNVTIKKLSKYKYKITFSKIGDFLMYQTWDKDNTGLNSNRFVNYVSAKIWVENFNTNNKYLKQQNKPLFTPTTAIAIKMKNQIQNYPIVIHKAYMNTSGHVVFTASTKEINSSKKLIKIPCGKFNNVRFDIDAPDRGWAEGLVYNVSDCGFPNVRMYAAGGRGTCSLCGRWLVDDQLNIIWKKCPMGLGDNPSPPPDQNPGNPPYDYNWAVADFWAGNYYNDGCTTL